MTRFFEDLHGYHEGLLAQGFWALQVYRFGHARFKVRFAVIRVQSDDFMLVLRAFCEMPQILRG